MKTAIPEEREEILRAHGFDVPPIDDVLTAFSTPMLALDTAMEVDGDHATDCAYIHYARYERDGEVHDGLFYAPSLLEHMLYNYRDEWKFDGLFEKINEYLGGELELVFVSGMPTLFLKIYDYDWQTQNLSGVVGDMKKLVGILDYTLSRARAELQNKKNNQ